MLTTKLLAASDFQTISDEAQSEVNNIANNIKSNLRSAIIQEQKRSSAKYKIKMNPSEYDVDAIQAEWDEVIADLHAGRFCNGCHKSKKQLEAEGIDFEDHVRRVDQGTSKAPQEDYDNANRIYGSKYKVAKEVLDTYKNAREERSGFIWNATTQRQQLHNKIQVAYDFQLKAYFPIKQNVKEVVLKNFSDLLGSQDSLIALLTDHDSNEYKNYVFERYSTTEQMDSVVNSLNQKRMNYLKLAENKKESSLAQINDIINLANQVGEDEVPSATMTAVTFNYVPTRDVYLSVRLQEKIESLLKIDTLSLYKKVKAEGK